MVSRLFFSLEIAGRRYDGLYTDVKQTVGSSYETGPIEVSPPRGASYRGPFNHAAFRDAAEGYYRSLVGSAGSGIRVSSGALNVRMRNNTFERENVIEFEASGANVAW
jgi:hypothetical protein